MSNPIPSIQKYMSASPPILGAQESLAFAHGLQHAQKICDLPVLWGGRLRGTLTQRDIALVESLKRVDPALVLVENANNQKVFTVAPEAPTGEWVSKMAAHKYRSTIVVQSSKVVALVTAVEPCSARAALLHGRLAK